MLTLNKKVVQFAYIDSKKYMKNFGCNSLGRECIDHVDIIDSINPMSKATITTYQLKLVCSKEILKFIVKMKNPGNKLSPKHEYFWSKW